MIYCTFHWSDPSIHTADVYSPMRRIHAGLWIAKLHTNKVYPVDTKVRLPSWLKSKQVAATATKDSGGMRGMKIGELECPLLLPLSSAGGSAGAELPCGSEAHGVHVAPSLLFLTHSHHSAEFFYFLFLLNKVSILQQQCISMVSVLDQLREYFKERDKNRIRGASPSSLSMSQPT